MAATKTRKTVARAPKSSAETRFTVVLEDIRGQFKVFGEALQGMREHMDRRFEAIEERFEGVEGRLESVEGRLALLSDAVQTHTKELRTIVTRLDDHEKRIVKLEGAAE